MVNAAGGGFDVSARALARHLGRHIPGHPAVVVDTMFGAGGLVAANYLYRVAKPDGLTIAHFSGDLLLGEVLGRPGIEFDARRFEYLGTGSNEHIACAFSRASGITSIDRWMAARTPVKLGGTAPGSNGDNATRILKAVLGLPIQLVSGYKGTAAIRLAVDSGELAGACFNWVSMRTAWQHALDSGEVVVVLQLAARPLPDLPAVPLVSELATTDEARRLVAATICSSASCCRSASARAGSKRPCRRSRRSQSLADLAGASVATVYPRLARALLPVDVTLVDVTGSVELAPRLGLADAIVDLVSSGSTLRTNGLRSLGVLLESEAVLVARDDESAAPFAAMLRAVVEARRHRYLMLNAPESALAEICALVAPARAERTAARGAGHGRGARARPLGGRLAAAARARGCRRVLDPDRPGRADGGMTIVADVKERGLDAVRDWALELDGVEPARAVPDAATLPREALLDARRPRAPLARGAAAARHRARGRAGRPARAALGPARHGRRLRAAQPALDARHVRRAGAGRRRARGSSCARRRRRRADRRRRGAARTRRGVGARRPAGDRLARLRRARRQDRRPRQRLRERGEARGRRATCRSTCPAGRPRSSSLGNGDPRLVELELAAQREHGPSAVCRDRRRPSRRRSAIAPEHLVLLGDAERYADRVRNAGAVFVGPWSPVAAGDYATGGNHVLPTNGWARSVGGLGLETFLKPVTVQRLTEDGLARVRPTVEALAAAEGMPAHAAAVRR